MATKILLAVAALTLACAHTLNDSKKKQVQIDPLTAKEADELFEAALRDEEPLLREEEAKAAGLRQNKALVHKAKKTIKNEIVEVEEVDPVKMSAFDSGEWASDFENDVASLILGLSGSGMTATPFGDSVRKISIEITEKMMPKVTTAHANEAGLLQQYWDEIVECNTVMDNEQTASDTKEQLYLTKAPIHRDCRDTEGVAYQKNVDCHEAWAAAREEKKAQIDAYHAKVAEVDEQVRNQNLMAFAPLEDIHSYWVRVSNAVCGSDLHQFDCSMCSGSDDGNFAGWKGEGNDKDCDHVREHHGMLADLECHKGLMDAATAEYNRLSLQCEQDDKDWAKQRDECDSEQRTMDAASCDWAEAQKSLCVKYETCHSGKLEQYENFMNGDGADLPAIADQVNDRKAEWRGLTRMNCLIEAFGTPENAPVVTHDEIEACKALDPDTGHLDITFRSVAELAALPCELTTLYPNTEDYKAVEFTPLPPNAKGLGDVFDCAGLNEISTHPLGTITAEHGCTCTKVSLASDYLGGDIVKCMGCMDVFRSKETNSCPVGTKIFSPQSRADWEAVLTSIGDIETVKAPNWIVDVTCPMGTCVPTPSSEAQEAIVPRVSFRERWVTADGSPWWQRAEGHEGYEVTGGGHCENFLELNPGGTVAQCFVQALHNPTCVNKRAVSYGKGSLATSCVCDTIADCTTFILAVAYDRYESTQGDYVADCFLGITSYADADTITMHQDGCAYHSSNYLCQEVKFDISPNPDIPADEPQNPSSCTCKPVALNGVYSTGSLIKCEKCLDVSKSLDLNSCPAGTKIWSPRTPEDWATFIASEVPLRDPHFIIDVTRPSGGCVPSSDPQQPGCSTEALNWEVPAQASWSTKDNSPWWLRETGTTFNQPSGDYEANCYMDLYHNPTNENDVQFDDHNCHVHSRSYFCQAKMTTTTTTIPTCGQNHACTTSGWVMKQTAFDLTDPSEDRCCEATCYAYTCQTAGWHKKEDVDLLTDVSDSQCCEDTCEVFQCQDHTILFGNAQIIHNPSQATCCEAVCSGFTCNTNYVKMAGIENQIVPTNDRCCEATCAAHSCPTGHSPKNGVATTTNPDDGVCCELNTCTDFGCEYGYELKANPSSITNPSTANCCNVVPTCGAHTCSTGFQKKSGVDSVLNPSDTVCCDVMPSNNDYCPAGWTEHMGHYCANRLSSGEQHYHDHRGIGGTQIFQYYNGNAIATAAADCSTTDTCYGYDFAWGHGDYGHPCVSNSANQYSSYLVCWKPEHNMQYSGFSIR
jgi:hypothetical protein